MNFNDLQDKKKVNFDLQSVDGNAFALMGGFKRQALKEKWTKEEVDCVLQECMSGDYDNLVQSLLAVTD